MDYLEPPAGAESLSQVHQQSGTSSGPQPQLRDRRKEKPMLSCTFCRSRKVRCDRQLPCKTCTNRGIGMSCTYEMAGPRKGKSKVSVGDRIQQLEELVRTLVGQQQQQTPSVHPDGLAGEFSEHSFQASPASTVPLPSMDEDTLVQAPRHASTSQSRDRPSSPGPSEPGS
ncbi:hypothetical protein FAGAP_13434, partial [Fusarium agapanthi]